MYDIYLSCKRAKDKQEIKSPLDLNSCSGGVKILIKRCLFARCIVFDCFVVI